MSSSPTGLKRTSAQVAPDAHEHVDKRQRLEDNDRSVVSQTAAAIVAASDNHIPHELLSTLSTSRVAAATPSSLLTVRQILSQVKSLAASLDSPELSDSIISLIEPHAQQAARELKSSSHETPASVTGVRRIGVIGSSGVGKSTALNKLVGVDILPVGHHEWPFTAAIIELIQRPISGWSSSSSSVAAPSAAAVSETKFEIEVELLSFPDWQRLRRSALEDLLHSRSRGSTAMSDTQDAQQDEEDDDDDASSSDDEDDRRPGDALHAVYGAHPHYPEFLEAWPDAEETDAVKALLAQHKLSVGPFRTVEETSQWLCTIAADHYHRDESRQPARPSNGVFLWPLVRRVSVIGTFPHLPSHVILMDVPGVDDPNRADHTERACDLERMCDEIWFLHRIPLRLNSDDSLLTDRLEDYAKLQLGEKLVLCYTMCGTKTATVDQDGQRCLMEAFSRRDQQRAKELKKLQRKSQGTASASSSATSSSNIAAYTSAPSELPEGRRELVDVYRALPVLGIECPDEGQPSGMNQLRSRLQNRQQEAINEVLSLGRNSDSVLVQFLQQLHRLNSQPEGSHTERLKSLQNQLASQLSKTLCKQEINSKADVTRIRQLASDHVPRFLATAQKITTTALRSQIRSYLDQYPAASGIAKFPTRTVKAVMRKHGIHTFRPQRGTTVSIHVPQRVRKVVFDYLQVEKLWAALFRGPSALPASTSANAGSSSGKVCEHAAHAFQEAVTNALRCTSEFSVSNQAELTMAGMDERSIRELAGDQIRALLEQQSRELSKEFFVGEIKGRTAVLTLQVEILFTRILAPLYDTRSKSRETVLDNVATRMGNLADPLVSGFELYARGKLEDIRAALVAHLDKFITTITNTILAQFAQLGTAASKRKIPDLIDAVAKLQNRLRNPQI